MEINPQLLELYKAWAAITDKELAESMWNKDVMDTHALFESLDWKLVEDAIHIMYNYYGIFPDMGVGKGVKLGDVRDRDKGRRAKKWYSKTMYHQVARLGELVAVHFGDKATNVVLTERKQLATGAGKLFDTIELTA